MALALRVAGARAASTCASTSPRTGVDAAVDGAGGPPSRARRRRAGAPACRPGGGTGRPAIVRVRDAAASRSTSMPDRARRHRRAALHGHRGAAGGRRRPRPRRRNHPRARARGGRARAPGPGAGRRAGRPRARARRCRRRCGWPSPRCSPGPTRSESGANYPKRVMQEHGVTARYRPSPSVPVRLVGVLRS